MLVEGLQALTSASESSVTHSVHNRKKKDKNICKKFIKKYLKFVKVNHVSADRDWHSHQ